MECEYLLEMEGVSISYEKEVVRNVSLQVKAGEILVLAGESGCGKTTLLNAVLGLPGAGISVTGGRISYKGRDMAKLSLRERKKLWGTEITMIYQDPGAAFNPIRSYRNQFEEMLRSHGKFHKEASYERIRECFEKLGLPQGERILESCPYEMSGGMNQRIAIAAALLLNPCLLLADEPTSALDVTSQKQTAGELLRLRDLTGTAMLLVTHHLGLAKHMADRIGIMYGGELVECGSVQKVLEEPEHPYTKRLLSAVPMLGEGI